MSRNWNFHCKTCGDTSQLYNTTHLKVEVRQVISHSEAIANLGALVNDPKIWSNIELSFGLLSRIDVNWFVEHRGHELVAIDEYGDYDDGK